MRSTKRGQSILTLLILLISVIFNKSFIGRSNAQFVYSPSFYTSHWFTSLSTSLLTVMMTKVTPLAKRTRLRQRLEEAKDAAEAAAAAAASDGEYEDASDVLNADSASAVCSDNQNTRVDQNSVSQSQATDESLVPTGQSTRATASGSPASTAGSYQAAPPAGSDKSTPRASTSGLQIGTSVQTSVDPSSLFQQFRYTSSQESQFLDSQDN